MSTISTAQSLAEDTKGQQPPTKKRRAARACERCRAKKYKCDESLPCQKCTKSKVQCVYEGDFHLHRESQMASYIHELEAKIEELNERLREVTLSSLSPNKPSSGAAAWTTPATAATAGRSILNQTLSPESIICENVTPSSDALEEEIREVNRHTNTIEFHGSTSSAAALGHLQRAREPMLQKAAPNGCMHPFADQHPADTTTHDGGHRGNDKSKSSLISTLHNTNFYTSQLQRTLHDADKYIADYKEGGNTPDNRFYFEYAHVFVEGYFENLHFIHPLIDKENFVLRARNLWFGKDPQTDSSFIALYLSLLSLGALIRVWDQPTLGGLTRFEWSRKLFAEAQGYLNTWCFTNSLEIVQALYLMAKICQNELAPHSYMYLGLAIRTCLAAGYNRETPDVKADQHDWISRTWWGLYSLEIELSFSLGRPDTLGMDEYHNRCQPNRDEYSEYTIIPIMVDLAHIIRRVSVDIYHSRISLQQRMKHSLEIEKELDDWLDALPKILQPDFGQSGGKGVSKSTVSVLRDPKWSRRQRLVLGIRYHNVKMFIFRPVLAYLTLAPQDDGGKTRSPEAQRLLEMAAKRCLDSAKKTVDIIYETFRQYSFFRCWWYNTTYIMFAVTNLLLPLSRKSLSFLAPMETTLLIDGVNKSIEILEAMDESVVAQESVEIVKNHLRDYVADINHDPTHLNRNNNALDSMSQEPGHVDVQAGANHAADTFHHDTLNDPVGMLNLNDMSFDEFLPDLMGSSDYPFESIVGLFGDITGPPVLV